MASRVRIPALAALLTVVLVALGPPSAAAQACSFGGTLNINPEQLAAGEPVQGNPDAGLLVTEFFDPNCPHCQRFHPVMQKVLQQYGEQIRVFMQPVPLWDFSRRQIQAMFIVKEKGKYYEMIDAQLTSPQAGKGGMTRQQIVALAAQIGLDPGWMRSKLASGAKRAAVNRLTYEAREAGVQGTPTLAIGRKIVGTRSASCIGRLIEQEGAGTGTASAGNPSSEPGR